MYFASKITFCKSINISNILTEQEYQIIKMQLQLFEDCDLKAPDDIMNASIPLEIFIGQNNCSDIKLDYK